MAYMRGDIYIWAGETWNGEQGFHIWVKDGADGWENTGWCRTSGENEDDDEDIRLEGFENASGTSISVEALDAFVMMRLAQIIYEGKVDEAIDNALGQFGSNTDAQMLKKNAALLRETLMHLKLEDAAPYVWKRDENGNTIHE